jgi:tetratricopeptide (TPR) repeat protein
MRKKLFITAAAAAVAVVAVLFGGALRDGSNTATSATASAPPAPLSEQDAATLERLLQGLAAGDTAGYAKRLEQAVERDPADVESLALLGLAYQQRARETGDPTFYGLSGKALRRAVSLRGEPLALTGLSMLALARHRWYDAIGFAKRALERNPEDPSALGALADAYLSLGRYDEAFELFDQVAVLAPSAASYARISYGRELIGRPKGAIDAMELAFELGESAVPEHEAWARVQLGNLYFGIGRLDPAERAYRRALTRYPGYVLAEAGLARVEAARGEYSAAIPRLERAVDLRPTAENAILLGDVLTAAGRDEEAGTAYELVDAIETLLEANGVRTELQTALLDLDRDRDLEDALARAREAYEAAPGINAADVLGWALYKNGRCGEARGYSVEALRLGTTDPLLLFHRGMIERCLGNESESQRFLSKALAVNPHFSFIHAPVAAELVA